MTSEAFRRDEIAKKLKMAIDCLRDVEELNKGMTSIPIIDERLRNVRREIEELLELVEER